MGVVSGVESTLVRSRVWGINLGAVLEKESTSVRCWVLETAAAEPETGGSLPVDTVGRLR